MRGVAFRCETLSSHFVCPSCSRRIAKDSSFNGSSRPFRSGDTLSRRKAFSTQTRVSVSKERLTRPKWAPPRFLPSQARSLAQSAVREPAVAVGDIEGVLSTSGEPTSRDRGHSEDNPAESRHDAVMRTLAEMQPDCVMDAFLDPQNYDILFKSLPAPTFAEAFRLLSPRYFTNDYIKLHRYLHPSIAEARRYKSLERVCNEFSSNITSIADMRRRAGHSLGLYEYAHLLDCARATGNGHMAYEVWKDMFREGVTPNLECYNYYMEARVWDKAYFAKERYNLRVTPFVQRKRNRIFQNPGFRGYKTGPGGVKDKVSHLFTFMTEQGIQGDEHTYVNTMVASCRVGHMSGVKDILKAVWDIDVDLLTSAKDERSLPEVRPYDPTSPLHPTERLLHAVAHIFGTNHDFPTGLQTVDFISRKYNIPIPEHVWFEILEWSFVLSVKKYGPEAYEKNPGKIPPDAVINVFNTITSEPYNVEPTMSMYHLMVKVSWNRRSLKDTLKYMRAGLALLKKTIAARDKKAVDLSILHHPFHEAQQQQHTHQIFNPLLKEYYTLCHEFTLAQIKATRDTNLLERWSRLLIAGSRRWTRRHALDWQRQTISDLLEEWQVFLPRTTYYQTKQGTVTFLPHQLSRYKTWRPAETPGDVHIREKGEVVRSMETVYQTLHRTQKYHAKLADPRRMSADSGDGEVVSSPEKEGG